MGGVVLTGKAPHSKCGGRKPMGVRVPPPPFPGPHPTSLAARPLALFPTHPFPPSPSPSSLPRRKIPPQPSTGVPSARIARAPRRRVPRWGPFATSATPRYSARRATGAPPHALRKMRRTPGRGRWAAGRRTRHAAVDKCLSRMFVGAWARRGGGDPRRRRTRGGAGGVGGPEVARRWFFARVPALRQR